MAQDDFSWASKVSPSSADLESEDRDAFASNPNAHRDEDWSWVLERESDRRSVEGLEDLVARGTSAFGDEWAVQLRRFTSEMVEREKARRSAGDLVVFVSFSMPDHMLREYAEDAHRFGARIVIRGLVDGDLEGTAARANAIFSETQMGGAAIEPGAFEAYGVTSVPTIVLAEGGYRDCFEDGQLCAEPPLHDILRGSVSVEDALTRFARSGDVRMLAKERLEAGH